MANKSTTSSGSHSPTTDSAAQTAHELVEQLSEKLAEAEVRIRELSKNAEKTVKARANDAEHGVKEVSANVEEYVHEHPLQALGFAFLGGLLLSSILRRR